jgi:hypothetical protein
MLMDETASHCNRELLQVRISSVEENSAENQHSQVQILPLDYPQSKKTAL